jgi:hypothetical protein
MPSRVHRQPNGLYARFSTIVDDFTDVNLTREEMISTLMVIWGMREADAIAKIERGHDTARLSEDIETVRFAHGNRYAKQALLAINCTRQNGEENA